MPPKTPKRNTAVPIAILAALLIVGIAAYVEFRDTRTAEPPPSSTALTLKKNVPAISETDHVYGNPHANVVIIEYVDFTSPFSKTFDVTMRQIAADYPDTVAWVVRNFPLKDRSEDAPRLALAAECAANLGGTDAYWNFTAALFAHTHDDGSFDMTTLPSLSESLGFSVKAMNTCIASGTYAKRVSDQFNDAVAAGALGSPFSVIVTPDHAQIPIAGAQSYENVKAAINAALEN